MRPDTVRLLAAGRDFQGWKSVRVRRTMNRCAGGFDLAVSWRGRFDNPALPAVVVGDACQVLVGEERVITGYVDEVDVAQDATMTEATVAGRDKTADLVDCSAVRGSGQWRGRRIEQVAAELAAPFGVGVRAEADTGKPLQTFALQEGETVFEAIERMARLRALLLVADAQGDLVITRSGTERVGTPLVLGKNVLSLRARADGRDRYSSYTVKGQTPGAYLEGVASSTQMVARAKDPNVRRYRPLIIVNDAPDVAATLQQRAQWEAKVRAARASVVHARVQGWRHDSGLWEPNRLVHLVAPSMQLNHELLIAEVEFSLDESGTVSQLTLMPGDAFDELPVRESPVGAIGLIYPKPGVGR